MHCVSHTLILLLLNPVNPEPPGDVKVDRSIFHQLENALKIKPCNISRFIFA